MVTKVIQVIGRTWVGRKAGPVLKSFINDGDGGMREVDVLKGDKGHLREVGEAVVYHVRGGDHCWQVMMVHTEDKNSLSRF